MRHIQQPFFRKVFLSYTILLIFSLLLILTPVSLQVYHRDQQLLEQERAGKVQLLVRTLDEAAADMEQIAQRLSGTNWVTKISSNSEILYDQIDYLTRRDICSKMARYHGLTRSVALLLPQKEMAVDRVSFWETDRYFSSIGIREPEFWQDFLTEAADAPRSLQLYSSDAYTDGFFVFRRLDYSNTPKQILLFTVDAGQLSNTLSRSFSDEICCFRITCQDKTIVTIGSEQSGEDLFSCPSEIYPWSYTFQMRIQQRWYRTPSAAR